MKEENKVYKIEISSRTIVFTVVFLIFLEILWIIKDLLFSIFVAFIIMSALKPFVDMLLKVKLPRYLASFIVFSLFLSIFVALSIWAFPPLITQFSLLIQQSIYYLNNIGFIDKYMNLGSLTNYLPNLTSNFFGVVGSVFSNAVFIISTLFFGFYFLVDETFIREILIKFFSEKDVTRVTVTLDKIEKRMAAWFWGETTLMTIIGVFTYIGLLLLGVPFAAPLAIIAGMLEAVPNVGPVLSAIPAFFIALPQSYFLALSTLALYFIIQQFENNIIVPLVMKKAVGLNPIITLIALIIGGELGGIMGVILAIPVTLFIDSLLLEILHH